jgi:alginate O-acetyltransferase complex protein AlgI
LIAGPIVRYRSVAANIVSRRIDAGDFAEGIRRFVIGMGKKMFIANPAGVRADQIFALSAEHLTTPIAWLGIACYSIQIYFDFSGYSDMAIGLGRMLGFHFLENFNYPYISRSVTEFWRRWHISLSTWFRDYLYIPIGGSRGSTAATYRNLILVFLLCGLWHGASWNFAVWGLLHGAFLVAERVGLGKLLERLPSPLRHAYTLFAVAIAWVFFRAETIPQALSFLACLFGLGGAESDLYRAADFIDIETRLVAIAGVLGATPFLPWLAERLRSFADNLADESGRSFRIILQTANFSGLCILFLGAITLVAADSYNPFIYFRF